MQCQKVGGAYLQLHPLSIKMEPSSSEEIHHSNAIENSGSKVNAL